MAVEDPFIAKARLQTLRRFLPVTQAILSGEDRDLIPDDCFFESLPSYRPIQRLGNNFGESLRMMAQIQKIRGQLPGIDCGACGAPTCRAFAEDVVRGTAVREDCVVERGRRMNAPPKEDRS